MFEHFGIKDAFVGLWKYRWIWIISGIMSVMLIAAGGMVDRKNEAEKRVEIEHITRYTASRVIMFESEYQKSSDLSVLYKSIIQRKECQEYVFDKILTEYSTKDLSEILGVGEDYINQQQGALIGQYVSYETLANQMAVELKVMNPDKKFAEKILQSYMDYINYSSVQSNGDIEVVYLTAPSIERLDKDKEIVVEIESVQKKFVIVVFLLMAFCVCGIFLYTMFSPSINRASDFENYNIPVLGEIHLIRGENNDANKKL